MKIIGVGSQRTAPVTENSLATRAAAREFEAAFLSEMLRHAGFDRAVSLDSGFGGEAMAGFMIEEIARQITERGGLGLEALIKARLDRTK